MAISHVQSLLFLIVSLFFFPSFYANDFEYCNKSGYAFGNVSYVEVSPTPIGPEALKIDIYVSGYSIEGIGRGAIEVHAKSKNTTHLLRHDNNLALFDRSYFMLPILELPLDILEGEFKYVVTLFGKPYGLSTKPKMCIDFALPILPRNLASS